MVAGKLVNFLPGSSVAAAGATRMRAGCWEGTMNLKLSRSVGSTDVYPLIGSGEQIGETRSACSSWLSLALVGLAKRGPSLSFSPYRGRRTQQPRSCPQPPNVRRSGALRC